MNLNRAKKLNLFDNRIVETRPGTEIYAIKDKRAKEGVRYSVADTDAKLQKYQRLEIINKASRVSNATSSQIPVNTNPDSMIVEPKILMERFQTRLTQPFEIRLMQNNQAVYSKHYSADPARTTAETHWEGEQGLFIYNVSDGMKQIFREIVPNGGYWEIVFYNNLTKTALKQFLRESTDDSHCILTPIQSYFENLLTTEASEKTHKNIRGKLAAVSQFLVQYQNGIPYEDMEMIAKRLAVGIVIEDPLMNELYRYNKNPKNKTFRYINSRINHGDYTLFVNMDMSDAQIITAEEMTYIIADSYEHETYALYTGTIQNPKTVVTPTVKYVTEEYTNSTLYHFTKTFDRGMYIDCVKRPHLMEYVRKSSHLVVNWKNKLYTGDSLESCQEIDMSKAYTQFASCPGYIGFPAIINNVCTLPANWDISVLGIYTVTITNNPNNKVTKLLRAMGITVNNTYTLTTPILLFLKSHGVEFDVVCGAYAMGKPYHFQFPQAMIDSKEYMYWVGVQLHVRTCSEHKLACTESYAQVLLHDSEKNVENVDMRYCKETKTLLMQQNLKHHYSLPHISAYIVSYTQLHVLHELMKYEPEQIYGTKLDSIIVDTPIKPHSSIWKDVRAEPDFVAIKFSEHPTNVIYGQQPSIDGDICTKNQEPYRIFHDHGDIPDNPDLFVTGQGGGGKTYTLTRTKRFQNVCYVANSWQLVTKTILEHKINGTVLARLIGTDCPPYKDFHGSPGVILLDEMSMIFDKERKRIKELYPYSQIIYIGDYANGNYYQSSIHAASAYHPPIDTLFSIDNDRRSKDPETRAFKQEVRKLMLETNFEPEPLRAFLKSVLPVKTIQDYDMGFILTVPHRRIDDYFTKRLSSPIESKNHYLVHKHDKEDVSLRLKGEERYLKGEILTFPIPNRTDIKHAFTVHSFQGSAVKKGTQCFMDIEYLFKAQDMYTALSRVECIQDLALIY